MPKYRLKIPNLTNMPHEVEAIRLSHKVTLYANGMDHGYPGDYFVSHDGAQHIERRSMFEKCYRLVEE